MKKIFFTGFILIVSAVFLTAQEPLNQKMDWNIDALGNAHITLSMTMNAGQWEVWQQNFGNNPAVLRRMIERSLPGYFFSDFKLDRNDMERSFEFSFKAYGVCEVNRRGRWILTTGEKNPNITEVTDDRFMMVSMDAMNNIQLTQFLNFPRKAKNIKVGQDAFGRTQFEFDMNHSPIMAMGPFFWIGILMLLSGAGWTGAVLFQKNKEA